MIAASTLFGQTASDKGPRLHLEGDGHACSGSLRVTPGQLHWKSSFSRCDGRYSVISHSEGEWTLGMQPGAGQACSFKVITLRNSFPAPAYAEWIVAGYNDPNDLQATPPRPTLGCPMQAADPR